MSATTAIVTRVDFVSIPMRDVAAAARSYENVLGLQRSSAWQPPGEEALGVELETGTVTIALVAAERLGIPFRSHKVPLAFQVDDVSRGARRARVARRHVPGEIIDGGVCHQEIF